MNRLTYFNERKNVIESLIGIRKKIDVTYIETKAEYVKLPGFKSLFYKPF